jgi:site-specific DNA-methyltransferase (adenine-specific)
MPDSEILLGDCRDMMKTLEAESFDSMVTDPPAGIAFMNSEWDRHTLDGFEKLLTEAFLEAYRVLKPGAHILVWSIPRTSHRTACAIEGAGFIIRDALDNIKDRSSEVQAFLESLTEEQVELLLRAGPADSFILHVFAQGMPKSHNVQKALAKAGSEEADKWKGFGSSLKPGVETWWLARKPLQEKTLIEQILSTSTGAINIDGCRVAGDMSELINPGTGKPRSGMGSHYNDEGGFGGDAANPPHPAGRWPANLVLTHSPSCKLVGSKRVKGKKPEKSKKPTENNLYGKYGERSLNGFYASEDGTEPVEAWECSPECPIKILDEQSGDRPGMSGGGVHKKDYEGGVFGGIDSTNTARADFGGASRFFNQFEPDSETPPFFYTGKITSSEREDGLENGEENTHPTQKTKRLMSHLVRLITPPKGRVLDPFCGSGSTIVAAIEEGMNGTGIEREVDFHEISTKRVQSALLRRSDIERAQEAWDLMSELESE